MKCVGDAKKMIYLRGLQGNKYVSQRVSHTYSCDMIRWLESTKGNSIVSSQFILISLTDKPT